MYHKGSGYEITEDYHTASSICLKKKGERQSKEAERYAEENRKRKEEVKPGIMQIPDMLENIEGSQFDKIDSLDEAKGEGEASNKKALGSITR